MSHLGFIHPNDRIVPCCECPTVATHIGWDDAPSLLCNTHLAPWMAWRGLTFNYTTDQPQRVNASNLSRAGSAAAKRLP